MFQRKTAFINSRVLPGAKTLSRKGLFFNPLYTGRLFHCYMLDKSICQFRASGLFFVTSILFLMENAVSIKSRPRSDPTLCGVISGSAIFAYYPSTGVQVRMG